MPARPAADAPRERPRAEHLSTDDQLTDPPLTDLRRTDLGRGSRGPAGTRALVPRRALRTGAVALLALAVVAPGLPAAASAPDAPAASSSAALAAEEPLAPGATGEDVVAPFALDEVAAPLAGPRPGVAFSTAPDPLARYVGQVACDPVARPGTLALRDLVLGTYGVRGTASLVRSCSEGRTEHADGRAWDWSVRAWVPEERAAAEDLIRWLTGPDADGVAAGNARRLGVMYLIWDSRIWEAYRSSEAVGSGWKAYTGASPHTDHVHLSLSWDGAYQRTSWWTGRAITAQDLGPCEPVPGGGYVVSPNPRYGAACVFSGGQERETTWYLRGSATAGAAGWRVGYGGERTTALACDLDGDGVDTLAVYRDGTWWLRERPGGGSARVVRYGGPGMRPVCGDWDDDGRDGIGVVDAGSTWWLRQTATAGSAQLRFQYGMAGSRPVVGDWDGDGRDGIGVVDAGSTWWLRSAATPGGASRVQYGMAGSRPVVGDWDGDGRDGIGVVDARSTWWLRDATSGGKPSRLFQYGFAGSAAVAGHWSAGDRADGVASVVGAVR